MPYSLVFWPILWGRGRGRLVDVEGPNSLPSVCVQDVVETQLMREISCRSRAMFEAAGELHDLHRSLCQTLDQIKVGVRSTV